MAEAVRPLKHRKVKVKPKSIRNEEKVITDEASVNDAMDVSHKNNADIHEELKDFEIPSCTEYENNALENESMEIPAIKEDHSPPGFEVLNKMLDYSEPFLKVQNQLNELTVTDQGTVPSAPQISVTSGTSAECSLVKLDKVSHSLVRQRCSDTFTETELNFDLQSANTQVQIEQKTFLDQLGMKPFSEMQLMALYDNFLLEEKENVITTFLEHEKNIMQNKFYDIVLNYLRARTNLIGTEKQIKAVVDDYKKQKEAVWTFEEHSFTEEGMCEDDQLLSVVVTHETATFQPKIVKHISKQLKQIRETIYELHSLHMYTSEMSKLQVENYLQQVFTSCPSFTSLARNGPVICQFTNHDKAISQHINHLRECISILMSFSRRNVQDPLFLREVRSWLSDSIAVLLRVASSEDHIFILNHLMRCSSGVGDWGSPFIQVVPPRVATEQDIFGSSLLDHLMVILAILLQPAKQREDFLRHFRGKEVDSEEGRENNSWIVVDSSGEDEEDATEMWHYFNESDIIQFLNQIPFEDMFKHVLLIETEDGKPVYDVGKATQHSILKLFAFCTHLLKLFQDGLRTYQQARYKGVVKRLSRFIRHTVHYVTDHWRGFITQCQEKGTITSIEDDAMALRLQIEYDEFFEKAVRTVFLSPRCGAWQFLAVVPYNCVSLPRLWKIAFKLHVGFESDEESPAEVEEEDWAVLLKSQDTKGRFHDRLTKLGDSEAYYLLTALANMAIVRTPKEKTFIDAIVSNLFDTTLVNEDLRPTLNRTGRDLFLTITTAHPFTVSSLLREMQEKLSAVGSLSLYIFRYLCLDGWLPSEEDLQCLSYWLLYTPASSLESQLARIIIAKMNWGFAASEPTTLALPRSIHNRIALLVIEIAVKFNSKIGQGGLLSEGVKQVTSVVYAPSHEQVFYKWCWSMLNQLHLHQMDQPDCEVQANLLNQNLVLRGIGDPSTSPHLEPLKKGLASKHPLTVFAAMLMSSWGHSVPEICNNAPECLETLASSGHTEAALTVLSLITPLFFNQHEELVSDARFVNALQCMLASDQTYVNLAKSYITSDSKGCIVNLFQGLIVDQITHFRRFNLESQSPIVKFWIDFLVLVPNWRKNFPVVSLVDTLCQVSLFDPSSWHILKEVFLEQRKIISGEKGSKGALGGILNWVSSSSAGPPSLLTRSYATEAPWFALCILICEAQEEVSSGLWKGLLRGLQADSNATLETVLKEVCSELQMGDYPSGSLALYRLGQQLLDLPCNHVAFPVTAQIFFTFHLARTPPQVGQYECSSVIHKFYEGFINGNFLSKIKSKMGDVFTFWETELAKEKSNDRETPQDAHGHHITFLSRLVATVGCMITWLEETRLYETGLYVPALPPQLLPKKLLLIFQENWDLWPELVDRERLKRDSEGLVKRWRSHRQCNYPTSPPSSVQSSPSHTRLTDAKEGRSQEQVTPSESILKRLTEYDAPKASPALPVFAYKSPSGRKNHTNKESVLYDIERFTNLVLEHSRSMLLKGREICALDCVFAELMPQLWTNPATKTVFSRKCKPKKNSKLTECSGPANIVVEYCEKRLNEGVKARMDQNREHHLTIYNQSMQAPPLQLCEAALHLEDLVNNVVSWHKSQLVGKDERVALVSYGRDLFYHFVHLSSEETHAYPPAKQLITSCSEALGQEFMRGHKDCQESLANQVLSSNSQFGVLLSPHFTPLVTPIEVYLGIYGSISPCVATQPDLCFMLLSKFEMETWLREKWVGRYERSQLIRCVCGSLASTFALVSDSTVTCLELYRVHLRALLHFNFPEHLGEILTLLLDLSVSTTDRHYVRRSIWYDVLNTLSRGVAQFSPDMTDTEKLAGMKTYARTQTLLSPHVVKEIVDLLASHFIRQRVEFGLYGLFSKYKKDVIPVTTLVGLVSFTYVITASVTSQCQDNQALSREIWGALEGLWAAWVSPLGGKARAACPKWVQEFTADKNVLLPWTPGDLTGPAHAVGMFASSLAFFHDVIEDGNVLSLFLDYYHQTYASSSIKDYILGVVHSQMAALPWHHLSPSLKDLELFSKIINEYLPECHSFVGTVFIQISWPKVVQNFVNRSQESPGSPPSHHSPQNGGSVSPPASSSVVKLHILLMNILVRISMEPSVRQSGLLHPLIESAYDFHWHLLDAKNFENVLNWFVMSCDPRIALQMDNRNPIDVSLIRLLHKAAGYYVGEKVLLHRSGCLKRRLLVRALCRLLTTSATRHKALLNARKSLFALTFSSLITHMEEVVVEGLPETSQYEEGVFLSTEAVQLIGGGASPPLVQEVCRDSLLQWLRGCHPSRGFLLPLAASISKGVLHLHHRSPLLNAVIAAILKHADAVGEREPLVWSDIVTVLSFPVTNPMPMLTFAAQENHLLVIYVHTKWRLHLRQATEGERLITLANLTELLPLTTPDELCEDWFLLVIGEAIDLTEIEVQKGDDYECVWRYANILTDLLSAWGEDRAFSGILAAIGLGKKSPLSSRTRLVCKCLGTFLRSQLLSPGYFCILNEHKRSHEEADYESDASSSNSSLKSLQHLLSLRSNATYAGHLAALTFALEFIQDSHNSILDTHLLLDGILLRLFPRGSSILQLRRKINSSQGSLSREVSPMEARTPTSPGFSQEGNSCTKPTAPPLDFE